jgi:hypothetical protein
MLFREFCTYGETALSNPKSSGETHTRRSTSEAATPERICDDCADVMLSPARNQQGVGQRTKGHLRVLNVSFA